MRIILEDSSVSHKFRPLTSTRHTALLRVGILTIREKWERLTGAVVALNDAPMEHDVVVPANIIPSQGDHEGIIAAARKEKNFPGARTFSHPWQLLSFNAAEIENDLRLLARNRHSQEISTTNKITGEVFLEEGVIMEHAIINASGGPVYIGKNAHVMEGAMIRGPFALGEGSVVKMGAKIYPATTAGPYCILGGEIKNSIILGYSNKAHDGYLGDSLVGEWCNLGAGTSNSNLKNTGGEIFSNNNDEMTALGNKAGSVIGDYSRTAINSSLNTGSVIGVCCNIFGAGPVNEAGNFSWDTERYIFEKALRDIRNWKKFKNMELTETEITVLQKLYKEQ